MEKMPLSEKDNINSEIFLKCFISLTKTDSCDDSSQSFCCTVLNQPRQGMLNIRSCWQFDFYSITPIEALNKAASFVLKCKDNNVKTYEECLKLRNQIHDL